MAAVIPALEPDLRPAYITDRGPVAGSFIRTGDGDKRLTHYEVDRMCESRMQPVWDTEHVSEASVTDLDAAVLKTMVERNRAMTPSVFGGMAGEEILVKTGVLAEGAGRLVPTLGGLLAAGVYPQQFFPRLNIVLTVRGTGETRSINGPVPYMVETAVNLLAERLRTADGFAYPLRACHEAVVNALQHRDYSPEGRGSQVRIDLFDDRLEILNPGGFFRAAVYNRRSTVWRRFATPTSHAFSSARPALMRTEGPALRGCFSSTRRLRPQADPEPSCTTGAPPFRSSSSARSASCTGRTSNTTSRRRSPSVTRLRSPRSCDVRASREAPCSPSSAA